MMKDKRIWLSYSSLNDLRQFPHSWLNKVMGIKKPDREYFKAGKEVHAIIQNHFSGRELSEKVSAITDRSFPIVEQEEFDKRCKIEIPLNKKYLFIGYFDGYDPETKTILEIKTSVRAEGIWSIQKYKDSIQRKLYALGVPEAKTSFLITAIQDPSLWDRVSPKTRVMEITDKDREEAKKWIYEGLEILAKGDFRSDLVDGKCNHFMCPYGENCFFK